MSLRCLECGFPVTKADSICPKCDANLAVQTDGSSVTIDIAHHGETIDDAMEKLRDAVATHRRKATQFLRVIVGGDRIRRVALKRLAAMKARGNIVRFGHDDTNRGALIVVLK